jgi:hypothetical protein
LQPDLRYQEVPVKILDIVVKMWQPAQENTVLSPKTNLLWLLSNSKVSSCRWLPG